jgi:hypothetical protein
MQEQLLLYRERGSFRRDLRGSKKILHLGMRFLRDPQIIDRNAAGRNL